MLIVQPDCQVVMPEDWLTLQRILSGAALRNIHLVQVYALGHNHQIRPEGRVLPWPVSLHADMNEAMLAAEGLRKRGRHFEIERMPAMRLDFGRYCLVLTLRCSADYAAFLPPECKSIGNVTHASFRQGQCFLTSLLFDELALRFAALLARQGLFFSSMGLALTNAEWRHWDHEGPLRWFSWRNGRHFGWLESDALLQDSDFAIPLVVKLQREMARLQAA